MTRRLRIDCAESALGQLDAMADYIAQQGQPDAARRLLTRFAEVVASLSQFPMTGHPYETKHPRLKNIRVIRIPGYSVMVYHRQQNDRLVIHAVLHGNRGTDFIEDAIRG